MRYESPIGARRTIRTSRAAPAALALLLAGAGAGAPTVAGASPAGRCADANLIPSTTNTARIDAATLCLIDRERAARGLRPLRRDARLEAAAQVQAAQMVDSDYFDHVSPTGVSPLQRVVAAGYGKPAGIHHLGENIAAATGSLSTPAASVANWMRSPTHRAQILDPSFRDTGIGVTAGVPASLGIGTSGATYAEDFGTVG